MNHRAPRPLSDLSYRIEAKSRILDAVEALGPRSGGLVAFTDLRKAVGLSRETFDRSVLEMQRGGVLDLMIANDPRALDKSKWGHRAADGIETKHGLLFYAVYRRT